MNKIISIGVFTFFLSIGITQAKGISFFQGTLEQAQEKAKKENKLIFVDAYAVWCGPCKQLVKHTFSNTEVGHFFNDRFINLKIDAEKGEGRLFAKKYSVRAYPTMFFINSQGEVVHRFAGFRTGEKLIAEGKQALKPTIEEIKILHKKFDQGGVVDIDFLKTYIKKLSLANHSIEAPLALYWTHFPTKSKYDKIHTDFFMDVVGNYQSSIATDILKKKKLFMHRYGDRYNAVIKHIVDNSIDQAILNKKEEELNQIISFLAKSKIDKRKEIGYKAKRKYYKGIEDFDRYFQTSKEYVSKFSNLDAPSLVKLAWDAYSYGKKDAHLDVGINMAQMARKKMDNFESNEVLAFLYYRKKDMHKALDAAKYAEKVYDKHSSTRNPRFIKNLIRALQ